MVMKNRKCYGFFVCGKKVKNKLDIVLSQEM